MRLRTDWMWVYMQYIKTIYENIYLLVFLARETLSKVYDGAVLGILWTVIKPIMYITIFWFFFLVGIRRGASVGEHEYLLFLFAGVMPWFYLTDIISNTTRIAYTNSSIFKNFNIPLVLFPIAEILSKFVFHMITMVFVMLFFILRGGRDYLPDIYYLNFIYYFITLFFFSTGVSYLVSGISFIIKDTRFYISATMQALFWITPVVWVASNNIETIEKIFNPLYYFLQGYRETMLYEVFFFDHGIYNLYIWIIIIFMNYFGIKLWYKLTPIILDNV